MFKEAVKRDLIAATPCVWDKSDLPPKEDRDVTRAREGGFTAEQVGLLIGNPRIPEDRRVLYALEFLTGTRTGEAAARRWRDWEPAFKGDLGRLVAGTAWNTRHRLEKPTKTRVVKWIPVHPELARILADWKREGWSRFYGRTPEPQDLIVPGEKGSPRNVGCSWRLWAHDLVTVGLGHQRHYESRSTFRNLPRAGGANLPDLDLITHPSPKAAKDLYDRTGML
jgi:integrase